MAAGAWKMVAADVGRTLRRVSVAVVGFATALACFDVDGKDLLEDARRAGKVTVGYANIPPYGFTTPAGEPAGDVEGDVVELGVVDAARHQADPLGLLTGHRLAQQQVVLALRHAAEQRPDDRGMVPGRDSQSGVAVNYSRGARRDRDVGKQSNHQAGADRRSLYGRNYRLGTVEDVVDQIARLSKHADASAELLGHLGDEVYVTACRERLPLAAYDDHADLGVGIDRAPDLGEVAVHGRVGGVQPVGIAHDDAKHSGRGTLELQAGELLVVIGQSSSSLNCP